MAIATPPFPGMNQSGLSPQTHGCGQHYKAAYPRGLSEDRSGRTVQRTSARTPIGIELVPQPRPAKAAPEIHGRVESAERQRAFDPAHATPCDSELTVTAASLSSLWQAQPSVKAQGLDTGHPSPAPLGEPRSTRTLHANAQSYAELQVRTSSGQARLVSRPARRVLAVLLPGLSGQRAG